VSQLNRVLTDRRIAELEKRVDALHKVAELQQEQIDALRKVAEIQQGQIDGVLKALAHTNTRVNRAVDVLGMPLC